MYYFEKRLLINIHNLQALTAKSLRNVGYFALLDSVPQQVFSCFKAFTVLSRT